MLSYDYTTSPRKLEYDFPLPNKNVRSRKKTNVKKANRKKEDALKKGQDIQKEKENSKIKKIQNAKMRRIALIFFTSISLIVVLLIANTISDEKHEEILKQNFAISEMKKENQQINSRSKQMYSLIDIENKAQKELKMKRLEYDKKNEIQIESKDFIDYCNAQMESIKKRGLLWKIQSYIFK